MLQMMLSYKISAITLCTTVVFLLIGFASCEMNGHPRGHQGKSASLILHVLRAKRFDFHIFECAQCHPSIQCHSDSMCWTKYGHDYKCMFECCELKCVPSTQR